MKYAIRRDRHGFTLMEVLVVVVLVGILTALAIVNYSKSVESSRADQAVKVIEQIASANHMYSLDNKVGAPTFPCNAVNSGNYVSGIITNACNTAGCLHNDTGCDLVGCGYLPKQDWDSLPYTFYALGPGDTPSGVCGSNFSGFGPCNFACATRKGGSWGYLISSDGSVQAAGGAPIQ